MDSIQFQNEKEKIIVVCLLPSQKTKLALANSTWLSCSGRLGNVLKSVMHVQCCCFDHENNCLLNVLVAFVFL